MGTFGSGVYFEGPIETKSMIMTPTPPSLISGAKTNRSSGTKNSNSGDSKVVKGLPGESYRLQSEINAVNAKEQSIRRQMYNDYIDSNGKADLTKYSNEITQLMDAKTKLQTGASQAIKRQDTWQETNKELKGKGSQYYADANGNYRTYEDFGLDVVAEDEYGGKVYANENGISIYSTDEFVKVGDIPNIVEQAYNVPNEFLNYRHVDLGKFNDKIASIFSETKGSNRYGEEEKAIAFNAIMNGKDPAMVASSLGFTGTSNQESLNAAEQDLASRINIDPEMRRAYEYGFNNYKRGVNTDGKTEAELRAQYSNDLIAGKKIKQQKTDMRYNIGERSSLLGLGDKVSSKETLRYKLAFGNDPQTNSMFDNVSKYVPGSLSTTITNMYSDEMRSSFSSEGLNSSFYKDRIEGNPEAEKKYKEAFNIYNQMISSGKSKSEAWQEIVPYVPEIMSGVNPSDKTKKEILTDPNKQSAQDKNPVVWYRHFIKGDNFEVAPLSDAVIKDQFNIISPGSDLPSKANIMVGANSAKEVESYEGLSNAKIVSLDGYARNIDINGKNSRAIIATLFIPNEDALKFGKNQFNVIHMNDEGDVVEEHVNLNDMYSDDIAEWNSVGIDNASAGLGDFGNSFDENVGDTRYKYPETNTGGLTGEQEGFTIKVLIEDNYTGIDLQSFEDKKNRGTSLYPSKEDQRPKATASSSWMETKNRSNGTN